MHNVFRIMTPSSRVVLRGIRLPFELVCHRHRWTCYYSNSSEFGGKEGLSLWHTSCPLKRPTERWLCRPYFLAFPLMPVREEEVEGGFRAISRTWTPKPPINPHYQGYSLFFAWHTIKSENKWSKYFASIEAFVKWSWNQSLDYCSVFPLWQKMLHKNKAKFSRHLSDWCKHLFA